MNVLQTKKAIFESGVPLAAPLTTNPCSQPEIMANPSRPKWTVTSALISQDPHIIARQESIFDTGVSPKFLQTSVSNYQAQDTKMKRD